MEKSTENVHKPVGDQYVPAATGNTSTAESIGNDVDGQAGHLPQVIDHWMALIASLMVLFMLLGLAIAMRMGRAIIGGPMSSMYDLAANARLH